MKEIIMGTFFCIVTAKNDVEQLVEKGYPFSDALKDLITKKWSRKLSYIKVV